MGCKQLLGYLFFIWGAPLAQPVLTGYVLAPLPFLLGIASSDGSETLERRSAGRQLLLPGYDGLRSYLREGTWHLLRGARNTCIARGVPSTLQT